MGASLTSGRVDAIGVRVAFGHGEAAGSAFATAMVGSAGDGGNAGNAGK